MNATYTGLYIASRGLYSSTVAESVTSNNISNANTVGYSRETVNQTECGPAAVYNGTSQLGNGSVVTSIGQDRDAHLDQRYWQENTQLGEWDTKSSVSTEMETALGSSSSDDSFTTAFDTFTSSLQSLATDPGDSSTRTTVQADGEAVCQNLNEESQQLTAMQSDENDAVKTTVDQINSYAAQIGALNNQISQASLTNADTNTLMDQRGVLIDDLSNLADVTVTPATTGTQSDGTDTQQLTIRLNGTTLVDGGQVNQLQAVPDSSNGGLYKVEWKNMNESFTATGGELKAELDMRDGDGTGSSYKGIPYYIGQLNKFAQTFAEAFNEGILSGQTTSTASYAGQAGGYTANDTTGVRFFSYTDASGNAVSSADLASQITTANQTSTTGTDTVYKQITAANITLSPEVEADVNNIAAASSSGGSDNSDNVTQLIQLVADSNMFNKGTPEDFYNSIISTLGTETAAAGTSSTNASSMVNTINTSRTSVSGVDTNDETANLTMYQQAYDASSKVISTWSDIYQKTIDMVNS